jgi:hypothetical protein
MRTPQDLDRDIVTALKSTSPQTMEQLLHAFPEVTWAQIFLAVDRLSRAGKIYLEQTKDRDYLIGVRAPFLPRRVLSQGIAIKTD